MAIQSLSQDNVEVATKKPNDYLKDAKKMHIQVDKVKNIVLVEEDGNKEGHLKLVFSRSDIQQLLADIF